MNRYFWTRYPYGYVVGSILASPFWYKCNTGDAYNYIGQHQFPIPMRVPPSTTIYSTTTGVAGKVADTAHALDIPVVVGNTLTTGIMVYVNNATLTYPVEFHWHVKADARL